MSVKPRTYVRQIDYYIKRYRRGINRGEKVYLDEFNVIWNGVGSDVTFLKIFNIPKKWQEKFREPSVFHDFACCVGGTSEHAKIADTEFYMRCMREAYLNPIGRLWAFLSYKGVRLGSRLTFEKREVPFSFEELRAWAQKKLEEKKKRENV